MNHDSRTRSAAWRCAVLALAAVAYPSLAVAQTSPPTDALRLTYLANEGVMLEGRKGRVLIDALFGDG